MASHWGFRPAAEVSRTAEFSGFPASALGSERSDDRLEHGFLNRASQVRILPWAPGLGC